MFYCNQSNQSRTSRSWLISSISVKNQSFHPSLSICRHSSHNLLTGTENVVMNSFSSSSVCRFSCWFSGRVVSIDTWTITTLVFVKPGSVEYDHDQSASVIVERYAAKVPQSLARGTLTSQSSLALTIEHHTICADKWRRPFLDADSLANVSSLLLEFPNCTLLGALVGIEQASRHFDAHLAYGRSELFL